MLLLSSLRTSGPSDSEAALSAEISNLRATISARSAPVEVAVPRATEEPARITTSAPSTAAFKTASRPGVIVLGMHRSGTSGSRMHWQHNVALSHSALRVYSPRGFDVQDGTGNGRTPHSGRGG